MNARQLIEDEMDDKDELLAAGRPDESSLDEFTHAYMEAALWSTTGENGHPLDRDYGVYDIAVGTYWQMIDDCRKFQEENAADLSTGTPEQGGHDFWLSRNGHGSGFFDDDDTFPNADRLQAASEAYGEISLYVGDDEQIHA